MRGGRARAVAAMLGAVATFAGMDALLKRLTAQYPVMEVAALRGAVSLPFMLIPVALRGSWRELRPRRPSLHLLRGLLMLLTLGSFVYALSKLSLANTYAVFMTAPLIMTALSVPLLGERAGPRTWAAIAAGLAGVVVMLRPSASGFANWAVAVALVSAIGYSFNALAVRVLTRTETTACVAVWCIAIMTLFATVFALPAWQTVSLAHWKPLLLLGILAAIAQHLFTVAYRGAPASVVGPLEYTALLWGAALDWVFWSTAPAARIFLGGGIVIAAGLYLLWQERGHPHPLPAHRGG
ncbi:MAG: DMT family transporter [Proteobacteria bacterium]|nr:DMT family transporter [Pseudomonadota bacterium]